MTIDGIADIDIQPLYNNTLDQCLMKNDLQLDKYSPNATANHSVTKGDTAIFLQTYTCHL